MKLAPIKPQSLVEQVSEKLSELILERENMENRQLPAERRLAEQMGVSRQVVREAIKRLELQGLLEVRQGVGIQIVDKLHRPLNSSLSLLIPDMTERLRQLNETRMAIEPEAARLASLRATPEQVQTLWQILNRLEDASDTKTSIEVDLDFHRTLAEASGNLMFRLILDSLAEIGMESRLLTIGRIGKKPAIDHHRRIMMAVEAHDPDAAAEAMRFHLTEAWKDMGFTS